MLCLALKIIFKLTKDRPLNFKLRQLDAFRAIAQTGSVFEKSASNLLTAGCETPRTTAALVTEPV